MTESMSSDATLADFFIPALWRAAEAQGRLTDVDFRPVFSTTIEAAGRHELLTSFAKYLEGTDTPVELSTLVALPDDGEAHFMDTTTPLIGALLIAIAVDARLLRNLGPVGEALRHQREQLDRTASVLLETNSKTVSLLRDQIPSAVQAVAAAIELSERSEWERIAALAIDPDVIGRIQEEVQQQILSSFTRAAMVAGSPRFSIDGRLPWRRLSLPVRMPRSMVQEAPSDPDFLVETLSRGFAEGELDLLETQLRRARVRTFGAALLRDRLFAAAAALPVGVNARALVPMSWDVLRQLEADPSWSAADPDTGRMGSLGIVRVPFDHSDSCYVVVTPGPFELVVRGEELDWLRVGVEDIPPSPDSAGPPEVRLVLSEEVVYRSLRGHYVRVAVPGLSPELPNEEQGRPRPRSRRARSQQRP